MEMIHSSETSSSLEDITLHFHTPLKLQIQQIPGLDEGIGIAMYWKAGVRSQAEARDFFPQFPDLLWDQPSPISSGYQCGISKEVMQSSRETDHSAPFSAEVKNAGAVPPLLHYVLTTYYLIKLGHNFTYSPFALFERSAECLYVVGLRGLSPLTNYTDEISG
jgi:hypothetical protein